MQKIWFNVVYLFLYLCRGLRLENHLVIFITNFLAGIVAGGMHEFFYSSILISIYLIKSGKFGHITDSICSEYKAVHFHFVELVIASLDFRNLANQRSFRDRFLSTSLWVSASPTHRNLCIKRSNSLRPWYFSICFVCERIRFTFFF